MSKSTSCSHMSFPNACWGCRRPFPLRAGHAEAIVGHDGNLYCYAERPKCLALALAGNAGNAA